MPYKYHQEQVAQWKRNYLSYVARTTPEERKRRRALHPSRSIESKRKQRLKYVYGMTQEQWEIMFAKQGHKCAICEVTEPGSKHGWHTDHDHVTGKVRGILCHKCNMALGNYTVARLLDFIEYIRKHRPYADEYSALPKKIKLC
jgi:hypothetical protein